MTIALRPAEPADVDDVGRILYSAFQVLADHHRFPRDFPSVEIARGAASMLIADPGIHGIVALEEGRIAGSNFIDLRSPIGGIGPISVDPQMQNSGVGRRLMEAAMAAADARGAAGIRLVQAAYHNRSLCLYTKLGFASREPLSVMQGEALDLALPGYDVRPAAAADLAACNALCRRVHGFDRAGELQAAVAAGSATVVEHLGRIVGYSTDIGFFGHAVAESDAGLMALIGAASRFSGPGFLLPTGKHRLFSWCLDRGLRLVMQMTLMTIGLYSEPQGAYLPSILY